MIDDSYSRDLDSAMMVRRDNVPGDDTPEGILTKMRGTRYESLIQEIEARADPATLELGFQLLTMGERTCRNVHLSLETITRQTHLDGKRHDVTLASSTSPGGVTFHCNPMPSAEAMAVLKTYCVKRKYQQRAAQWFGVSVDPAGGVQFGITLDYPWRASGEMDRLTADMKKPLSNVRSTLLQHSQQVRSQKLGRNDPCRCGSGLKYKKCCLN